MFDMRSNAIYKIIMQMNRQYMISHFSSFLVIYNLGEVIAEVRTRATAGKSIEY